jgi:hypothetical protein
LRQIDRIHGVALPQKGVSVNGRIDSTEPYIDQLPLSLRQLTLYERKYMMPPWINMRNDQRLDAKYLPQNSGAFELPCFWVSCRHLRIFRCAPEQGVVTQFFRGKGTDQEALFPIHPASLEHYRDFLSRAHAVDSRKEGLRILAVPTSSVRTLLTWPDRRPDQAIFVKASLPFQIGGNDRCIHPFVAARGVAITSLLDCANEELPETFEFLAERAGIVPKATPESAVIARSIPERISNGPFSMAPAFALWGADGRHVPILLKLLQETNESPLEFIARQIVWPLVGIHLRLLLNMGLMSELHFQNLLVEVDYDGALTGKFYARDLDFFHVDWQFRIQRKLPIPSVVPYAHIWRQLYLSLPIAPKISRSVVELFGLAWNLEPILRVWHSQRRIRGPAIQSGAITRLIFAEVSRIMSDTYNFNFELPEPAYAYGRHWLTGDIMRIKSSLGRQS